MFIFYINNKINIMKEVVHVCDSLTSLLSLIIQLLKKNKILINLSTAAITDMRNRLRVAIAYKVE